MKTTIPYLLIAIIAVVAVTVMVGVLSDSVSSAVKSFSTVLRP